MTTPVPSLVLPPGLMLAAAALPPKDQQRLDDTLTRLHATNSRLWLAEDRVRGGLSESQVADCKREIDQLNAERNHLAERADEVLAALAGPPLLGAVRHTETLSSALDRLSVLTLRIWRSEEAAAFDPAVAQRIRLLHKQRAALSDALDSLAADVLAGIGGTQAVLVVETGIGTSNAEQVLAFASEVAKDRRLYLTTTHFHPEHAFGAQAFAGQATYLVNRAQADDLAAKGPNYLEMFRGFGGPIAARLDGVRVPTPDVVYDDGHDLDLGGRTVRLRATGRGHTRGDQVVEVPDAGVLFTGDLAETGQFAIFPWFPPYDTDVSGVRWLAVMDQPGRHAAPARGSRSRKPRRPARAHGRPRLPPRAARRDLASARLRGGRGRDRRRGPCAADRAASRVGRPGVDRAGRGVPLRRTRRMNPGAHLTSRPPPRSSDLVADAECMLTVG
ncbi:DUF4254 domain-containing protein [Streptomyces sp. NBC_01408]|uniref:DUF4254 domain-containing protein n=1 Tax=Streptomyces sp. NBC_01408 TaxID=2903855 RepID=UPI00224D3165|nr:DUF4254 domain-containing protein [Streptomyces sp. NBC_01408]MCX4694798.1 DUF4254 domain-containing protein [Streptomyces sp. NBC_01408]